MSLLERKVGEIRPTQLIYTYGIGQVVDLPQMSGLVMGLDDWPEAYATPIIEERLLDDVRNVLGPQVEKLVRPPPEADTERRGPLVGSEPLIGVPVAPFPRYLRCPFCRILAPIASGLFKLVTEPGRPDRARFVHLNCNRAERPRVLPARFLLACEGGHLDDFPWHYFVHGATECDGMLQLDEPGHTGEAADIRVQCRKCAKKKNMSLAFGEEAPKHLPRCTARRPHLRDYEEKCEKPSKTVLLGASGLWFSAYRTALHIPSPKSRDLDRLVERDWTSVLALVDDVAVISFLRKQGKLGDFRDYSDAEIWKAIQARKTETKTEEDAGDLKVPEWRALAAGRTAAATEDFELEIAADPSNYGRQIRKVVLVKRLRAVTALVGFTRIIEHASERQPLSRHPPRFVPASEVRGEGIFIELLESELVRWVERNTAFAEKHFDAHRAFRRRWGKTPDSAEFPGLRFVLLHTFSHALMRELSLECGYPAASIRERIYSNEDPQKGPTMAGVLLYTAAPDSEGTLGGLVRMGRPEHLTRLIANALESARLCSSDPLCAEHIPDARNLHGAACHACGFAPETSCEAGNRYLDRAALVTTVASETGFFD